MNDAKKLCLEQLQTSKRQLVWNKEHELRMITMERGEVRRMELSGEGGETITKLIAALNGRERNAKSEIAYASSEIDELTKEIAECV